MRRFFAILHENRVTVLAMVLFAVVAALIYMHTQPSPITAQPARRISLAKENRMEPTPYPLSRRPWGHDPFISPFIEERIKFLKKLKEEEEKRRQEEERRRREEEERRRREEEERKKKAEEERRRRLEEQRRQEKKHLAELAHRIKVSGIMILPGGSIQVFLNGRACVLGSFVWQNGERFRVIKVTETHVVLEDRLGQKHTLEIEK